MKMEQMMECLIATTGGLDDTIHDEQAEMKVNQAKTDASLREIRTIQVEMKKEIKSGQEE
jgi:hypothetical protein